jgi:hypothetical protein
MSSLHALDLRKGAALCNKNRPLQPGPSDEKVGLRFLALGAMRSQQSAKAGKRSNYNNAKWAIYDGVYAQVF